MFGTHENLKTKITTSSEGLSELENRIYRLISTFSLFLSKMNEKHKKNNQSDKSETSSVVPAETNKENVKSKLKLIIPDRRSINDSQNQEELDKKAEITEKEQFNLEIDSSDSDSSSTEALSTQFSTISKSKKVNSKDQPDSTSIDCVRTNGNKDSNSAEIPNPLATDV